MEEGWEVGGWLLGLERESSEALVRIIRIMILRIFPTYEYWCITSPRSQNIVFLELNMYQQMYIAFY